MLEDKTDRWRDPGPIDDVGAFEQRERRLQVALVSLRSRQQEIVGKFAPDDGRNLRNPATWCDAVEPLHQCIAERIRNLDRCGLRAALGSASRSHRRAEYAGRQFLYEERDTIGLLDNLVDEIGRA